MKILIKYQISIHKIDDTTLQKPSLKPKNVRSKAEQSYPSIVREILISRGLSADQKVGWWELIKALKAIIMIGRIWWREKLLRQRIQLCEHVNQLLHTEFRFSLRFWVHFVGISGNLSNRSHGKSKPPPHKNPQQFATLKIQKLIFWDRKPKRNTRNLWDSLVLQTPQKEREGKKCRICRSRKCDQIFFLRVRCFRKLEVNQNPFDQCSELLKKQWSSNGNKEN